MSAEVSGDRNIDITTEITCRLSDQCVIWVINV